MTAPRPPIRRLGILGAEHYPAIGVVTAKVRALPASAVVVLNHGTLVGMVAHEAATLAGIAVDVIATDPRDRSGRGRGQVIAASDAVWVFGLPAAVALARVKGRPGRLFGDDGAEVEAWG